MTTSISLSLTSKLTPERADTPPKFSHMSLAFKVVKRCSFIIERFEEWADEFWTQLGARYKFIVQRDKDYLNWRYCDPRGGKGLKPT
jgi:hypothetical protein